MRSVGDVFLGCDQIQASTLAVLKDPLKWLDWIDLHRVTTTWAPNFAFNLLTAQAAKLGARKGWDLSSLKSGWRSGEAVILADMKKLYDVLGPFG